MGFEPLPATNPERTRLWSYGSPYPRERPQPFGLCSRVFDRANLFYVNAFEPPTASFLFNLLALTTAVRRACRVSETTYFCAIICSHFCIFPADSAYVLRLTFMFTLYMSYVHFWYGNWIAITLDCLIVDCLGLYSTFHRRCMALMFALRYGMDCCWILICVCSVPFAYTYLKLLVFYLFSDTVMSEWSKCSKK